MTHTRTHEHSKSNMPHQRFQSWGHKKCKTLHYRRNNEGYQYTFQHDLKLSSRIAEKVNKINSTLFLIVRTFDYIETDSFILLFKALIRPRVEYGNAIWHPFLRKEIESVEKVQKNATNLVPELKDLTSRLGEINGLQGAPAQSCAMT